MNTHSPLYRLFAKLTTVGIVIIMIWLTVQRVPYVHSQGDGQPVTPESTLAAPPNERDETDGLQPTSPPPSPPAAPMTIQTATELFFENAEQFLAERWTIDQHWRQRTTGQAHSGSGIFALTGGDQQVYSAGSTATLTLNEPLNLPVNARTTLSYWQRAHIAAGDHAAVQVSLDQQTWMPVRQHHTQTNRGWTFQVADLSAYAGHPVFLRFVFNADADTASVGQGWHLDDIRVFAEPTPIAALSELTGLASDAAQLWIAEGSWLSVAQPVHSGASAWQTVAQPETTTALTLNIDVDLSVQQAPHLSFVQRLALQGTDTADIQLSLDSGLNWNTLATFTTAQNSTEWTVQQFDLSVYQGRRVRVRFLVTATSVNPISVWALDNIAIQSAALLPTPSPEDDTSGCQKHNPERLDCSSLDVSGVCDALGIAVFTITNTGEPGEGDMVAPTQYRLLKDGQIIQTGDILLPGGQSMQVTYAAGGEITLEADQQVGHPGNSHPRATLTCQGSAVTLTPPTPAYVNLQLTSVCSDNPNVTRRWQVHNSNPYDVEFLWQVTGGGSGSEIAPASSDYVFETAAVPGSNTMMIFVAGVQNDVKASSGDACTPPTDPPPTATDTPTSAPPTATETEVPPTDTDTATTVPPTETQTDIPPTATDTDVPPTVTNTASPMPSTATDTDVPPTATATEVVPTDTDVPQATDTSVPPTAILTATLVPSSTSTPTPIPTIKSETQPTDAPPSNQSIPPPGPDSPEDPDVLLVHTVLPRHESCSPDPNPTLTWELEWLIDDPETQDILRYKILIQDELGNPAYIAPYPDDPEQTGVSIWDEETLSFTLPVDLLPGTYRWNIMAHTQYPNHWNPRSPWSYFCVLGPTLRLSPETDGPNPVNATQELTAILLDAYGQPMDGENITLSVTGDNSASDLQQTDLSGMAILSYIGTAPGKDTAVATAIINGQTITSNEAEIYWFNPSADVSMVTTWGRFYQFQGDDFWNTLPNRTPLFEQEFPSITFNPDESLISGMPSNNYWSKNTLINVVFDETGTYIGEIPAQGNGYVAGSNFPGSGVSPVLFDAVFTGELVIETAGEKTLFLWFDDQVQVGIGGNAVRVPGSPNSPDDCSVENTNTVFMGFPIMCRHDAGGANYAIKTFTVDFPAPGRYPFEIEHTKSGAFGTVSLVFGVNGQTLAEIPTSTVGILHINPSDEQEPYTDTTQSFTVSAEDTTGAPRGGLTYELTIEGANGQTLYATDDDEDGQVTFEYTGYNAGGDLVQASVWEDFGLTTYSPQVAVNWQQDPNAEPPSLGSTYGLAVPGCLELPNRHPELDEAVDVTQQIVTGQFNLQLKPDYFIESQTQSGLFYYPVDDPTAIVDIDPSTMLVDTTLMANGSYIIEAHCIYDPLNLGPQVLGTDQERLYSAIMVTVVGENKPGRVRFSVTDFTVPIAGLPIAVGRTYDSLERNVEGDFGHGWSLAIGDPDLEVDYLGNVTMTLPTGQRKTFYFTPYPPAPIFGFLLTPKYTSPPGEYGTLESDGCKALVMSGGRP
ncbi:MAG: hypothetical protein L0154_27965, partial [Chloroflexi bacterium]|nr:hypothetical protein [Chloroflexota bacterium]